MSVYTTVTPDDLAAWLTRYALGRVRAFDPVTAGIENTNYFLTTDKGSYVLTLYERLPAEELPFYLNLMAHLARAGVTAPAPETDRTGALFSFLNGKPAGLVERLAGAPVERPDRAHCAAVGRALAELHVAARQYRGRLANRRAPFAGCSRRNRTRSFPASSSARPVSRKRDCRVGRSMATCSATTYSLST